MPLKKHRESVAATVLFCNFFHLNSVVGEEEIEGVELVATIIALVLPVDRERKDFPVVLEERVKVTIVTTTTKAHFKIIFEFSLIRRVLLEVDHGAGVLVEVIGECFTVSKLMTLLGIEVTREGVAVVDTEDAAIDVQVHRAGKITPVVGSGCFAINGYFVALKENSLGESSVLLPVLQNVDGVVLQVVEHGALVNAEVLIFRFDNRLLEVGIEAKHLSVVLEPLRSDLRDGIVLVFWAGGNATEVR